MAFSGSGAGTLASPYEITSWAQLHEIRDDIDAYYILNNDLDQTTTGYNTYASSTANSGAGWEPIGTNVVATRFNGELDGQGNLIKDLFISRPVTSLVGLFGFINSGTVKNLGLEDCNITGGLITGGMVGIMNPGGYISGCHTTGTVTGSDSTGGFIGQLDASFSNINIEKCYSTASATGENNVGGFIGETVAGI